VEKCIDVRVRVGAERLFLWGRRLGFLFLEVKMESAETKVF
jgi:hypothetical protein